MPLFGCMVAFPNISESDWVEKVLIEHCRESSSYSVKR